MMVSIIIPVFNTSIDELLRCLNSIISQPYSEYEILIIDDGSRCLSMSDFEMIEKLDTRIFIFHHTSNLGVSAARNTGMIHAKGDYIAFVDGDDEIDSRFLTEASSLAEKYDADLVMGTLQYIYDDRRESIDESDNEYYFEHDGIKTLRRAQLDLSHEGFPYIVLGSSSAKLIRKKIAEEQVYNEKIAIFEDQVFVRRILLALDKAVYIHHIWYYYYQHNSSSFYAFEKTNGRRAMRFNPEYLKENNYLNTIEPDSETRGELLCKSLREFAAAVNYWFVQNKKTLPELPSRKKVARLFDATDMRRVIDTCSYIKICKLSILVIYKLLKYKRFGVLYQTIAVANSLHSLVYRQKAI